MIHELKVNSSKRIQLIDLTGEIEQLVSDIDEGVITLFVPHTTAAVTINEGADPSVKKDVISKMSELVPKDDSYMHLEGNSDSHIKTSLFSPSLQMIVKNGKLLLGTWQSVFFCEFDGPRTRKLIVKLP